MDAALAQDVGICRLIRQLSPDFPIHASTQMTITSAAGVKFARELGCSIVVLARECSLAEIEKINLALRSSHLELPLEACRMPYDLIADGKQVPLGDRRYLLSPQDLAGLEMLPDLLRAGVASLKIEGRLKTPEYVANITRIYRQALDQLRSSRREEAQASLPEDKHEPPRVGCHDRYEMEMAFSRGLYTGWLRGINNQKLVHGRFGKKRGVYLGEVSGVGCDHVLVRLEGPLKPGDGVGFDAGRPDAEEQGGRVYEVRSPMSNIAELRFGRDDLDFSRIHVGDKLWKTSDPELDRRLRRSFEGDQPRFRWPIQVEVHGRDGLPLTLVVRDELG